MAATTSVRLIECTDPTELYCRYSGQSEMQPAYIELDLREGTLLADYNAEVGNAIPFSVYHGFERRYSIPVLTDEAANRTMRELLPLAERILADWEDEWNGNDFKAVLGPDAEKAEEEILEKLGLTFALDSADVFDDADKVGEWGLDGVVNGSEAEEYDITPTTTDERLDEIEQEIIASLDGCGLPSVNVCPELADHLRQIREDLADDED